MFLFNNTRNHYVFDYKGEKTMKFRNNLKSFTLGMVVCLLITTLVVPAFASNLTKTAKLVYDDIKITLNGNIIIPKDANGNTVEPFTIDGTTYLPARAISNSLGINVTWDGASKTVVMTNTQASPSGKVLYDNYGIKITYLGIATMKYGGEEIKLYIENKSDKNYVIQTRDESVNEIMTSPSFSCSVASGKSAYDSIKFADYTLEKSKITSINSAEFKFLIADFDHMSDFSVESDIITISK